MITAIYAGSFDPFTLGHEQVVLRATQLFSRVIVAVGKHHTKRGFFDVVERMDLISQCVPKGVEVTSFQGLLFEFARSQNAKVLIRGLRAHGDFESEYQVAMANRDAAPELETVFLLPDANLQFVSSSLVREIISHGGDISKYVRPCVVDAFNKKMGPVESPFHHMPT